MNFSYIVNSLIWSIVGAVLGYQYCKMKVDVNRLKERVKMEDAAESGPGAAAEPPATPGRLAWLHRFSTQQIIGAVVVIMAVMSTGLAAYQSMRLNTISTCLGNYAVDHAHALKARDDVAVQGRQDAREYSLAQDELWLGLLRNAAPAEQQPTPAQRVAQREASLAVLNIYLDSSRTYRAALDAADKARADFPIPVNRCASPDVRDR